MKPDRRDNPCKHIHLDYDYDSYGTQSEVEKLKNYCSSGYFYNLPANEFYVLGAIAGCSGTEQNVTPF